MGNAINNIVIRDQPVLRFVFLLGLAMYFHRFEMKKDIELLYRILQVLAIVAVI